MRNLPVHWSEGMFLRPHHFQAAERYWSDVTQLSEQWDHAYYYGLRRIELSEEAISNYQFDIKQCHARMRDGTMISIDAGHEPDRKDLREALNKEATITVYLGVPKFNFGHANVVQHGTEGKHRYVARRASFQDETTGGNDQEVDQRQLSVSVLLSSDDLTGYDLLPIAKVRRSGELEPQPELDTSYIPPVLAIDAWRPLRRDIVRWIFDFIGTKIEVLCEQIPAEGFIFEGREAGDLDRLFLLSVLNTAYSILGQLCFADGVHPFTAYKELCRVVGMLAVFGEQRRPVDLPKYDHDDLAPIFEYVRRQIETLVNRVRERVYERRFFVGSGHGMSVSLQPHWFHADWKWYIGVDKGELAENECRELLSSTALDWKLGSSRRVEALFENRKKGLDLRMVDRAPSVFPSDGRWIYYEVDRTSPEWPDVQQSQSLAMRLRRELIINLDKLQGEQRMVVRIGGHQATLQFALFALPTGS